MRPSTTRARLLAAALAPALAAAAAALPVGCHRRADEDRPAHAPPADAPRWLVDRIRELERAPVANPPASVVRYTYKGRTAYYLPPRCCDVPSDVYDADGRLLCHPEGGITGTGDGRCPDFLAARTDEHLVWRDRRAPAAPR